MATRGVSSAGSSMIDVNSLVDQLMTVERKGLTKFVSRERDYTTRIAAYAQIKGALSTFQGSLSAVVTPGAFENVRAAVSNTDLASASATKDAASGTYSIEVTQLARQHRIASVPQTATTSVIGSGQITFQFGTYSGEGNSTFAPNAERASVAVSIPVGSNTLAGIRDAVNSADAGVSATIVNDGTGNRLVFTSKSSGEANALKITVSDNDGNDTDAAGLSALAYDPSAIVPVSNMTQINAAKNAIATIDGLAVTSASNTLDRAIQGLSITLKQENPGKPATLTVSRDTVALSASINGFVAAYNDAMKALSDASRYDAAAGKASTLTGDPTIRTIQSQLRSILTGGLPGGVDDYRNLSDVGIRFDGSSRLTVDSSRLGKALADDPAKVSRLFARTSAASDSRVDVQEITSKTPPGDYGITLTSAATQGTLVGSAAANLTISSGVNDSLSVTVDGKQGTITLPAGTYASAAAFASDLQVRINSLSALSANGMSVKVTESGGALTITSERYGSTSTVSVSGNGAEGALGAARTATAGVDAKGTIGASSAAGSGRSLSSGNGIKVAVNASALGDYGSVRVYEGFAARIDRMLADLTGSKGALMARIDGLNESVKGNQKDVDAFNLRLQTTEKRYRLQFTALSTTLSSMSTTSDYLSQQIAQIQANSSR